MGDTRASGTTAGAVGVFFFCYKHPRRRPRGPLFRPHRRLGTPDRVYLHNRVVLYQVLYRACIGFEFHYKRDTKRHRVIPAWGHRVSKYPWRFISTLRPPGGLSEKGGHAVSNEDQVMGPSKPLQLAQAHVTGVCRLKALGHPLIL